MRSFLDVAAIRATHASWRLLRSENAPLTVAFLGSIFVDQDRSQVSAPELEDLLGDYLYSIEPHPSGHVFSRSPKEYLDAWSHGSEAGWLRKFYPTEGDEAHFEATSALTKAVAFVDSLRPREFVGTESRMTTLMAILAQMAYDAEPNVAAKHAALLKQRADLDQQIAALEAGHVQPTSDTLQRDRWQQFLRTHQELLADFREVEENFRALDRQTRTLIAGWQGPKADLLDIVLGGQTSIQESNQGRTVRAFHNLLLSAGKQAELRALVATISAAAEPSVADELRKTVDRWLDAALRTQRIMRSLSRQLNRFLDDKVWLENQRVASLLRHIEQHALAIADPSQPHAAHTAPGLVITGTGPQLHLPLERPLFAARTVTTLQPVPETDAHSADTAVLAEQHSVDDEELSNRVHELLTQQRSVALTEVLAEHPVTGGLEELLTYLVLTGPELDVERVDQHRINVAIADQDGHRSVVDTPQTYYGPAKERR